MNAQFSILALPEMPALTREPSFAEWEDFGKQLKRHDELLDQHTMNFRFVIVEWYDWGIEHFNHKAERVARELGYDKETIQNWKWTKNHTAALRASPQGDGLEYEHLRQLAAVKNEGQQRELAARVTREKLSGGQLRREIRSANGKPVTPATQVERVAARGDAIEQLIAALCEEGAVLMQQNDPLAQAQADVKLDCAARLRDAMGRT
jgi:hypothetical protein